MKIEGVDFATVFVVDYAAAAFLMLHHRYAPRASDWRASRA